VCAVVYTEHLLGIWNGSSLYFADLGGKPWEHAHTTVSTRLAIASIRTSGNDYTTTAAAASFSNLWKMEAIITSGE
jgi:hypothetical protein